MSLSKFNSYFPLLNSIEDVYRETMFGFKRPGLIAVGNSQSGRSAFLNKLVGKDVFVSGITCVLMAELTYAIQAAPVVIHALNISDMSDLLPPKQLISVDHVQDELLAAYALLIAQGRSCETFMLKVQLIGPEYLVLDVIKLPSLVVRPIDARMNRISLIERFSERYNENGRFCVFNPASTSPDVGIAFQDEFKIPLDRSFGMYTMIDQLDTASMAQFQVRFNNMQRFHYDVRNGWFGVNLNPNLRGDEMQYFSEVTPGLHQDRLSVHAFSSCFMEFYWSYFSQQWV
jgi:hypothetical protein